MNESIVINKSLEILKQKGPMAAVVLSYLLKEDCAIDVNSFRLAKLISMYGKGKIASRLRTASETGFGSYKESNKILIYEAIG